MPKSLPQKMANELPKLEQNALIELWEIDLRHISSNSDQTQKGELLRFHNGLNQGQQNVWWQGNEYQAIQFKRTVLRLAVKVRVIDRL